MIESEDDRAGWESSQGWGRAYQVVVLLSYLSEVLI